MLQNTPRSPLHMQEQYRHLLRIFCYLLICICIGSAGSLPLINAINVVNVSSGISMPTPSLEAQPIKLQQLP